ncbi:MAG: energy transducer TonB family protein, partial [Gammaproteobacteria bacterium]
FGESAVNALASWRFLPPTAKTQSNMPEVVQQEFRFNPSGNASGYRGPDCGGKSENLIVYALAARIESKPPPQRPADLPDRVNLGITRPPVTQTFAAPYNNHAWLASGSVTMRFCVNEQGHTENLRLLHSTNGGVYDKVAMGYMHAALFKPHTVRGWPVTACGITQTIIFRPAKH